MLPGSTKIKKIKVCLFEFSVLFKNIKELHFKLILLKMFSLDCGVNELGKIVLIINVTMCSYSYLFEYYYFFHFRFCNVLIFKGNTVYKLT